MDNKTIITKAIEYAITLSKKDRNQRCYYLVNIIAAIDTCFPELLPIAKKLKGLYSPTDRTFKALHKIVVAQ